MNHSEDKCGIYKSHLESIAQELAKKKKKKKKIGKKINQSLPLYIL